MDIRSRVSKKNHSVLLEPSYSLGPNQDTLRMKIEGFGSSLSPLSQSQGLVHRQRCVRRAILGGDWYEHGLEKVRRGKMRT